MALQVEIDPRSGFCGGVIRAISKAEEFLGAHPGAQVKPEPLYDAFTLLEAGQFIMVVTADEYPWTYTVTMTFPRERQAEYEFYAEIIRNSFGVWGLSHG